MNALLGYFRSPLGAVPSGARLPPREVAQQARMTQWLMGTLASLALAVWIVMAEVDRLIADAANSTGRSASASSLQAIDPRLGQENWTLWNSLAWSADGTAAGSGQGVPGIGNQVAVLLGSYFILDVLFACLYSALLIRLLRRWTWVHALVVLALASEAAESAIQLLTLAQLTTAPGAEPLRIAGLLTAALIVTILKWVCLAGLLVIVLSYPRLRAAFFDGARRAWRALFIHRITLGAILLIAALALLPIEGVNDQMPDTQRDWIGAGMAPFLITSGIVLIVVFGLFFVGRRRSELIWRIFQTHSNWPRRTTGSMPEQNPRYRLWLVPAVVLALGFFAVGLTLGWQYWSFGAPLLAAIGVPVLAVVVSMFIERRFGVAPAPKPVQPDCLRAWDTWRCGDVLALSFLAISGMALVRSFTAPLALQVAQGRPLEDGYGGALALWVVGVLTVAVAFPLGAVLNRVLWGRFMDPRVWADRKVRRGSWALFVAFALSLAIFAVLPVQSSAVVGVAGTATLLVGAWAVVIGLLVVSLQGQRPLRVFESMRLEANPVLSLIAVTMLVGTAFGGTSGLHDVRQGPPTDAEPKALTGRLTVEQSLTRWLNNDAACTTAIDATVVPQVGPSTSQGLKVRPMILVAAEGGGIRAASWTVRAFEKLAPAKLDSCAAGSVILSSGVSGGSLGLTLSRLYEADAMGTMEALAKPGPLAAAVTGAMVGDVVGAGTGLTIPTRFLDPANSKELLAWNDRAGLMESVWEQSAGKLAKPFETSHAGRTGALMLNSTDTGTGCRVVISQIDLPAAAVTSEPAAPGIQCAQAKGFPLSVDLLDQEAQCPLGLRWSTVTLLSGRFPIISPAARAPAAMVDADGSTQCHMKSGFQLIDGGYSEGSALGTIADVWPVLQRAVLAHNSCVVAIAEKPQEEALGKGHPCEATPASKEFVIPVFLFLQNSPGSDIVARAPEAVAELMVPVVGWGAKALQSGSAAWIQRLEGDANVCPVPAKESPGSSDAAEPAAQLCTDAAASVTKALGDRSVVVVAPNSVPALAAPLGWSLSTMSQRQLAQAMDEEARILPNAGDMQPFARLLAYLDR